MIHDHRLGAAPWPEHGADEKSDDFEILAAARDCARYLDARGWKDVRCFEVRRYPPPFTEEDPETELIDIGWQVHIVGAPV